MLAGNRPVPSGWSEDAVLSLHRGQYTLPRRLNLEFKRLADMLAERGDLDGVRSLIPGPEPGRRLRAWRNYWYPTDPVGGRAISDFVGKTAAGTGSLIDERLLDPPECGYVYGTAAPGPKGHSGYWSDKRVWDGINEEAAALAVIPGDARTPAESAPAGSA